MNNSARSAGFRFTLINFFTLPAILILPFTAVLMITTRGMSQDGSIQTALNLLQTFLYVGPVLLIGWTVWIIRRLKKRRLDNGYRAINILVLGLPYLIILVVGGAFAYQSRTAGYQKQQTLETRAASGFQLPDSLAATHHIGLISQRSGRYLAFPDSGLKPTAKATQNQVCLIRYGWDNNDQTADTTFYALDNIQPLTLNANTHQLRPTGRLSARGSDGCLITGNPTNRPAYTGLSRYGTSSSGEDQFEAYVAGADEVDPVLKGFEPFDYQLLNGLIADGQGRNWFFMRDQQALFAGFLRSGGTSKVYRLKGEGLELPDSRHKPKVRGLAVHRDTVWLYSPHRVVRFPLNAESRN